MNKLLQIGFTPIGTWELNGNSITSTLNQFSEKTNVIYCFIINAIPKYFGITRNTLRSRMYQYANPGRNQSTNIRINKCIKDALESNSIVEIYVFADNGLIHYGDFKINLALGLEETLINAYQTEWNYRGNNRIIEVENQNIQLEINEPPIQQIGQNPIIEFDINIVATYKNIGFINIPAQYSEVFPSDGESINVQFGDYHMQGFVDRANNNGYPRIRVGVELRDWIRSLPENRQILHLRKENNVLSIS
jgi:hypothetical protein